MQYTTNYQFALPADTDDQWGDAVNGNFAKADGFAFEGAYCAPPIIALYAGNTDPAGWLICDGRAVSRTTYAALFATIGTTYGVGDGSTTFAIPDLRGRFACGAGQDQALGTTGGANTVSLDALTMARHTHAAEIVAAGSHTHTASQDIPSAENKAQNGSTNQTIDQGTSEDITTSFSGKHTHPIVVGSAGSSTPTPHENRPAFVTLNYIIKT